MSQSSREGGFGINVRPEFAGLLQVQYLDSKLVPGATHGSPKRLIVVGDVHGCKAEREYRPPSNSFFAVLTIFRSS
jgi:hypothetical protein